MNAIRKSMSEIRATEDLKKNTLQYLLKQQEKKSVRKIYPAFRYALTAACLLLLFGAGGYSVYRKPESYISIDVNPSFELGINRFGRVVSADAYNEDGQSVLQHLSLRNIPYIQAIGRLLEKESSTGFLKEDSLLVFTIVSNHSYSMMEELSASEFYQGYETLMYTSDALSMAEAHTHEMSFGRYRAYQELSQYDSTVTVEDCHDMTMSELHSRIESCSGHQGESGSQHHTDHHGTAQNGTQEMDGSSEPDVAQNQDASSEPDTAQGQDVISESDAAQGQDVISESDAAQGQDDSSGHGGTGHHGTHHK